MNTYQWADDLFNSSPRYNVGFTELFSTHPYWVTPEVIEKYEERLAVIRRYQETVIGLFRSVLTRRTKDTILHWLLNETPESIGVRFHKALKDSHFTCPVFFRTDEAAPGKIVEIQCPGSLWGELQLLYSYSKDSGYVQEETSPAKKFAEQLGEYLGAPPVVQHLTDNSSAPAGMRYFIESTRPAVKYWGIDQGIKPRDCNFIRSHSFFGLCAESDFKSRLSIAKSHVKFDFPPHVIFDQKAPLVLPFWSATRNYFTDAIREILLFSTPLLPSGIEMPDNSRLNPAEFSRLPQSERKYYLKYAGTDVSKNWGSKAVFRLKKMGSESCLRLLNNCLSHFDKGQIWLLQKEEIQDDEIEYSDRHNNVKKEKLRAKFSAFYGPRSCIGIMSMHRNSNKVHGQEDTVISYVTSRNS